MGMSDRKVRERIARLLRAGRKLRGLYQSEMATELGVTQSAISKLESADVAIDAGTWYHFCKFMDLNPDYTFSSGYLFTRDLKEKIEGKKFKVGKLKTDNLIKVKECIPFVNAIVELNHEAEFNVYLKTKKIDPDVFTVPEYKVPLPLLGLIFDFLTEKMTEAKFFSITARKFVDEANWLAIGAENSINKLIQNLNQTEKIFDIKDVDNSLVVTLASSFKYSKDDENFLKSYMKYKSQQLKLACTDIYGFKGVKVQKVSNLHLEIQYSA